MELNRLLEIAAERAMCDLCADCRGDACIACAKVKGVTAAELREYHVAVLAALRRTAEDDKAREEGRLVVLPFPLHSNAVHTADPTEHLNNLRLSVTWTSKSSIIFSAPLDIFTQQIADGLVKLTRQAAEAALEVRK